MTDPLRVLIVEDSEQDAVLVLHELRRRGRRIEFERVQTAETLNAALDRQPWDIVISDYRMPTFSAPAALALVRKRDTELPFIIVSGTIGEEVAVEAMKAGANDYVMKGNLARLLPAVERELRETTVRRERRQAEAALRNAKEISDNLIQTANMIIIGLNTQGEIHIFNQTAEKITGYTLAELKGKNWFEILVPKDRYPYVWEEFIRLAAGGVPKTFENPILTKTGEERYIIWQNNQVRVEGKIIATISFGNDITERRQAEAALRENQRALATLMSNLPGMAYRCRNDKDWTMEFVSKGCYDLTGYPPADLIGNRKVSFGQHLIHPDDRESLWNNAQVALRKRQPYQAVYRIVAADMKEKWVWEQGQGIFSANGELLALEGFITDITERQRAEDKVRRLNRVYAMLSGINALIVRAHDRDELFREACRLAVEVGQFRIAWIGLVDRAAMRIAPVVWSGEEQGLLQAIEPYLSLRDESGETRALVARAVIEKRPLIVNDVERDPRALLRAALVERDIRSLAAFPLTIADETVGALVLLARTPGFFDDDETKLLVELAGDIAFALDHIEKEERINYLAYYDSLTGLANRALFYERLTQFIHTAQRERRKLALSVVDLDHFKNVNDALGRRTGDALLVQFAQRLTRGAGDASQIARLGADRFAVVLPDIQDEGEVLRAIEVIMTQCVGQPFRLADTELRIAFKVGIALYPHDGADADTLFRDAEAALKKAKAGGERYLFYTQQMTDRVAEKVTMESELRRALENEEFVLHYQPKVDVATGRISGVEALIRWKDPQKGLVLPMKFIPLLEETGIILDVGAWVMRRAVQDHDYWTAQGAVAPRIAVNVSAVQLRQRDFLEIVRAALGPAAKPAPIEIEITESLVMENIEENIDKLKAIHDLGVNIAIDDFGTGYSSLGYLARLPVQVLKIDLSFSARMLNEPDVLTLVSTMISLAHSMRIKVVAEGVETEQQAKALCQLKCDELQGYLIGPPVPREQITELLRRQPWRIAS